MESWQEDRILGWLIAATKSHPHDPIRYFIDLDQKILFFLEKKNESLRPIEQHYYYLGESKKMELLYLKDIIDKIKHGNSSIIEFPILDENFPKLQDPNAHFFTNSKEHLTRMHDDYRRIEYAKKILEELGIVFKDLKQL